MEVTVEQKLKALYSLQKIDTAINKIKAIRGELPMEVADLEDELAGLETRLTNLNEEVKELQTEISDNKIRIKEAQAAIKKYDGQLSNVKNNREYDALNKEMELQNLEIQAAEKRIKEYTWEIEQKNKLIEANTTELEGRKQDLENKKAELGTIVAETEREEAGLMKQREKAAVVIEERLLNSYNKIRNSVKNGIAVASIVRDSCSGCFAKIPPQRQADIRQHKKILVCEHCGRVLVDAALVGEEVATA
jgi:predicted  nucleic acid-binding Zn-ribbon protein